MPYWGGPYGPTLGSHTGGTPIERFIRYVVYYPTMTRKLISHGTIGLKLLKPNEKLNLTNTKRIDKSFNEEDCFSFNISGNHIAISMTYIDTNKMKGWMVLNKDIKRHYPNSYELRHPKLVSVIQVWVYDKRFKKLLKNKLLTSRYMTKHHCIKYGHPIKDDIWGKVNLNKDYEMLVKDEKLKPNADILLFSSDALKYFNGSFETLREYYNIPKETIVIVYNTTLRRCMKQEKKYSKYNPTSTDKKIEKLCNDCIDNKISNAILGVL